MIAFTRFPRVNRALFIISIVCLLTTLLATIFVAARSGGNEDHPKQTTAVDAAVKTKVAEQFGRLPLSFEVNEGQLDPSVKFLSRGPSYELFLTTTEAVLLLRKPAKDAEPREGTVLRLKMLGANTEVQVVGQDELPGKINYFSGNDPEKWRRNVSTFRKVYYKDLYRGIDVVYYGNQRELEYDFVIAPGANPNAIKFRVEGAQRIRVDDTGSLLLGLKEGEVRLNKPFIYQLTENGSRNEVKGAYAIKGNEISFKVRGFDARKQLVIDPVLSYSTFLGTPGNEIAQGIAIDSQGSAYVTGFTEVSNFPTTSGAFKTTSQFGGAFVTKLDPTGSSLVYSTYLNGSSISATSASKIAVDAAGNAYVTGLTTATDFPLVNPLKSSSNFFKTTDSATNWNNNNTGLPGDVQVIAVAPNALQIIYAATTAGPYRSTDNGVTWTKLPTTGLPTFMFPQSMVVSPVNSAVVYLGLNNGGVLYRSLDGGNTWNLVNLPNAALVTYSIVFDPATPSTIYLGTFANFFRSTDSGSTWTTLGNFKNLPKQPEVHSIAIDPTTPSTMYATIFDGGVYKTTDGGLNWSDINGLGLAGDFENFFPHVVVVDPFNSSTLYTGHGAPSGRGNILKTTNGGTTWTSITNGIPFGEVTALIADRSTPNKLYAVVKNNGIFKTTNGGASWTSANAGVGNLNVQALVAHPANSAIMYAGAAGTPSSRDAFVTKLNSTGSALLFSTYLGGGADDNGAGIAVDASGNIYVVGQTNSNNFPTVNALQSAPSATETCTNGFVTKINPTVPAYVFSTYLGGSRCDETAAIALDAAADIYLIGNTNSSDFPLANAFQATLGDSDNGDAFVTKLTTGGSLVYSTFLGGSSFESGRGIAVTSSGEAVVAGTTSSPNFPTLNPLQTFNQEFGADAFVAKFNSQGTALVYSTYLGGDSSDTASGIDVDAAGNAYVVGTTNSRNFPVMPGALRTRSTLFKTIDGGANWSNDNYGLNYGINASITALVVHPNQSSTIYAAASSFFGGVSGVFKSTNGGRTWSVINNGLSNTAVAELLMDPATPSTLYAATVGGVFKSTDNGNTWVVRNNGFTSLTNVIALAIDPVSPATLYAGIANGALEGQLFKTTDGGDNWVPLGNVPPSSFVSLVVDPHNHSTIYGAADINTAAIFRSVDSGVTWNPIGVAQTGGFGRFVGVSPHTPGLLYAQVNAGTIKSVDGGDNWSLVTTKTGEIAFDPVSASTVYLLSAFEGVLKSTDNGATWVQLSKGYAGPVTTAFAIDPQKTSTVYFATLPPGAGDSFVTKINPSGTGFIYSTFLGGIRSSGDFSGVNALATGIFVDDAGNAYVCGMSQSPTFPTTSNSFQPLYRGQFDAFISKLIMSFSISGRVADENNVAVSGAEIVLNDGTSLTQVLSETDGSYEFSHLPPGELYQVNASKPHFAMTPNNQSFLTLTSDVTLNFTAKPTNTPFHTISGQVTNNGAGLAGVKVSLNGSEALVRTTDANGNYSFELQAGGFYRLTPSLLGFTFGPVDQFFDNLSASQTANFNATRQSFVVTNANNHGDGSLRDAIVNANATVGTDTIVFNIPGPGVKTINLVNQLPDITDPVVIDATTQPGYAGSPLIEINGVAISSQRGLVIKAGGSTVRGLAIGNFSSGTGIHISNCDNNVIQANYLGLDATGTTTRANGVGLGLSGSSNNLVGGTTAAARNVISGNTANGITVAGGNNTIQGNYIGTNASGTASLGNGLNGIDLSGPGLGTLIGGTTPGAGNLISGNARGIFVSGSGTTIQGNLIGTDVTGTQRLTNSGTGIFSFQATNTLVGGLTTGARNIISGNGGNGVFLSGAGNKIQGNFIGTDITGTQPLGNSNTGVVAGAGTLIGGTTPEARNVISANGGFGNISLGENNSGVAATVQGNYIGTDVTGTKSLSSTSQAGITVLTNGHLIGGTVAGAGNVISGNVFGIQVGLFSGPISGNAILGNLIGLNAQGTGPLPNTQLGVQFTTGAQNNTLGGIQNGAGNTIAFNQGPGVFVFNSTGNSIRGNSIFSNSGLGIDLGVGGTLTPTGVTPNDLNDADIGANNLQNFPVLTTVSSNSTSTTILGTLNSTPNTTFRIDFYSNAAIDPSGNGEGGLFFGTTSVTTDGSGNAAIDVSIARALPSGRVITATATDPGGNTSEFSAADPSSAAGSVQFNSSTFAVIEDIGTATITVQRTGGILGNLSVDYETSNGTATAGQDYTATSGTLNFANGETSKTIQIPIADDAITEPDETFTLALKNPSSLDAFGSPTSMTITIQDRTTVPALLAFTASVIEGDSGTTTNALMEVRLSAATGRTVSVSYSTQNGNAFGGAACGTQGVDYESTSGSITFQPGTFSIFVPVKVCGDKSAELNEGFLFNLTKGINATIGNDQSLGTILNDDVIELVREDSSPISNQAAALDALLFVRDPFGKVTVPELFAAPGFDRNTRVMLFVRNLELNPGENPTVAVILRMIDINNQVFEVFAEDFRQVPGTDLMQVVFRLPNSIAPGHCAIFIRAHGRISNLATIQIAP